MCIVYWRLWYIRNQVIHGQGDDIGRDVVNWCMGFMEAFRALVI